MKKLKKFDVYMRVCRKCGREFYSFSKQSKVCFVCDKSPSRRNKNYRFFSEKSAIEYLEKLKGGKN